MSETMTAGVRLIDDEYLARCADLKRELVQFAQHNRFGRAFREMAREHSGPSGLVDEFTAVDMLDRFALQHRLHDGRTIVEHFVERHRKLTDQDKSLLLSWQDVVEGIFEVEHHDDGALLSVNLLDDLGYRIYSNMGSDFVDVVDDGSFMIGRIVPIGDAWMISGQLHTHPADQREPMYRAAAELSMTHPAAVFRNPEKLNRAWEIQREERRMFIAFFGSDLVVMPAADLRDSMQAFMRYRTYEARGADGKTTAERSMQNRGAPLNDVEWPAPDLAGADTVAIIYDEDEGLTFLEDFSLVEEAFAKPEHASAHPHRDIVRGYLEDETVPPMAFGRLAKRDPDAATQVFRAVLDQSDFEWARDGEALMRKHKPSYFERPRWPSVTVVSERIAATLLGDRSALD